MLENASFSLRALHFHHGMLHMTCDVKIAGRDRIEDGHAKDMAHSVTVGWQLRALHQDGTDLRRDGLLNG